MMPAVMMAPVPVVMVVTPAVVAAVVPPAAMVVMVVTAPAAVVMAVAPAVMMAVLDLHHLRGRRRCGTGRERGRLGGTSREETAGHQGGRRPKPLAGRQGIAQRQHGRLRFVPPHPRAALETRVAPGD